MRKMTLIAAVVASLAVGSAMAQTGTMTKSEPGKVSVADSVKATATVTAVDKATRLITLQGQDGNSFVVQAGPEVKNFDQIKSGDLVVVQYVQALTLEL